MTRQLAPLSSTPWPDLNPGTVHLWQLQCSQAQDQIENWWPWLDGDEQRRAQRFYRDRDRHTFILSRGGLRWLLGQYLQQAPQHITFGYGEYGKPEVLPALPRGVNFLTHQAPDSQAPGFSPPENLQFNLAHSGDWVVYGITWAAAIGVDVEVITPRSHLEGLIDCCLTPREQTHLAADPILRLSQFFDYWTVKEAHLKATGHGLRYAMTQVEVDWQRPPRLVQTADSQRVWQIDTWSPAPGVAAAVCVAGVVDEIALGVLPAVTA
ncbi:4'-phosphopantetheinyl transferase family protein [Leptolyngbya sp. PCC 6406]|uniref:4'-phosphopantetheinyl transferase family protein n=1 Tax=Leptolyngbya sp. PCC 6406 TaxID=1173264 RepID=UPI0002AB9DB2|nr:4'-phosphopantetheinyl transferase superfamily protein [Leptolyngbya sp. PCC 6406]